MNSFPITNPALRWLEIILKDRFDHDWHLSRVDAGLCLELVGADGTILFDILCAGFTLAHSEQPCTYWDAEHEGWSSVLGGPLPAPGVGEFSSPLIVRHGSDHVIHYDILGLTYWMLARVEEIGRTDLDEHERFPATSSHAYQHGYLDRPVVDEWLHLLGQVIQCQWPGIILKNHEFSINVTHDVDQPSLYAFKPWHTIARMMAGHLIKRRDFKAFIEALYVKIATRDELIALDPYNTFDWLMDLSEKNNLKSAFYFICGRTNPARDADYEPEHPIIRQLMRRINERGHEIGLHPSYHTFQAPEILKKEADRMKRICAEEEIQQTQWGGRMHYLRWAQPTTLRAWAEADMAYDSTLGYADRPGFRCGTAHEYTAFDSHKNCHYNLKIRPLILMDTTIFSQKYLALNCEAEVASKVSDLKQKTKLVNGRFELLFHNCSFQNNLVRRAIFESLSYND